MNVLAQRLQSENEIENKHSQFITDDEGFLLSAEDWSIAFSEELLKTESTQFSSDHLKVIYFVREKVLNLGGLPPLRLVCKSIGMEKIELMKLFGSCINLWKAAGLPKPDDEIRSYMN